ncbi:MAG TPA: purine-nucleoside phosphorylase, partial [Microvirga sp.]|nr:purine-nucleoside phosphorylase [Microvirga sp.]
MQQNVQEAAEFVRARGFDGGFDAAFVLGTGLGTLVDEVEEAISLAYADIPHFPRSGVSGHAGRLVAGRLEGKRVLLFQGRAHYYETGDAGAMRIPVALVKELGISVLVATNATGSVRASIRPGSLV